MKRIALAGLLIVAVLVGAGAGYLVGNASVRTITSVSTTSIGGCPGTLVEFQAIPVNFTKIPVLLMRPNAIASVCVTYRAGWADNQSQFSYYSDFFKNNSFSFPTAILKATCTSTSQSSSCYYMTSHSFNILAYPNPIQPSASVDFVTVVYSVTSLPNATGFYDHSFIPACEAPRLAVGYSAQQVNSSDFAPIGIHSCFNQPYLPVSIAVSGMNVTYVAVSTTGK